MSATLKCFGKINSNNNNVGMGVGTVSRKRRKKYSKMLTTGGSELMFTMLASVLEAWKFFQNKKVFLKIIYVKPFPTFSERINAASPKLL